MECQLFVIYRIYNSNWNILRRKCYSEVVKKKGCVNGCMCMYMWFVKMCDVNVKVKNGKGGGGYEGK